jgi:PAS domain S-box-containing protein
MREARILIIHPEEIEAESIENSLISLGHCVTARVSSGTEALERVGKRRPDLAVMDTGLLNLVNELQAAERLQNDLCTPIIYLIEDCEKTVLHKIKAVEPSAYLMRPFSERELSCAIEMGLYRCRVERNLQESEERYRNLFEGSRDAIFVLTKDGVITDANQSFRNLSGYMQEEVAGIDAGGLFLLADEWTRIRTEVDRSGSVEDFRARLQRKDGTPIDALVAVSIIRDINSLVTGIRAAYAMSLNRSGWRQRSSTCKNLRQSEPSPPALLMILTIS